MAQKSQSKHVMDIVTQINQYINSPEGTKLKNTNYDEFYKKVQEEHTEFHKDYSSIFNMTVDGKMTGANLQRLVNMVNMQDRIQQGNVGQHNADVAVGKLLYDQYVDPLVDKKKEQQTDK
jgi:hypothetical protein